MTHRKHDDLDAVVAIQNHIAARAELNQPFPKLGLHLSRWTARFRMALSRGGAFTDRSDCPAYGISALARQECMKPSPAWRKLSRFSSRSTYCSTASRINPCAERCRASTSGCTRNLSFRVNLQAWWWRLPLRATQVLPPTALHGPYRSRSPNRVQAPSRRSDANRHLARNRTDLSRHPPERPPPFKRDPIFSLVIRLIPKPRSAVLGTRPAYSSLYVQHARQRRRTGLAGPAGT